jgi:hypothetical protein
VGRALRLLTAIAIAAPLLVATGGRAVACSCAPLTARQTIHRADAIVAGHIVDQIEVDPVSTRSTLAVDGVYKGRVAAQVTLVGNLGSGGGSACAVLYPVGAVVDPLVLERHDDGTYEVSTCSLLSLAAVRARLGEARPPPAPSPASVAAAAPSIVQRGLSWPAVLGGVAVALLLMAWALRRAHRERAVRTADGVRELQAVARASAASQDRPEPSQ